MNSRSKMKWEKIRAKGKKHYVVWYGVLGWGLSTGVFFTILSQLSHSGHFWLDLLVNVLIFLGGGYFWGTMMWRIMERQYHKE